MTSLQKVFVSAAALVLALTVGGGAASAQDDEIVGIEISGRRLRPSPSRYNLIRAIGSATGVTVDLTANTVRLTPGKYWIRTISYTRASWDDDGNLETLLRYVVPSTFSIVQIPAVYGQDSIGTTVEVMGGSAQSTAPPELLVVVNGDGATRDEVKLGTVGRRVGFYYSGYGATWPGGSHFYVFIRRLGD